MNDNTQPEALRLHQTSSVGGGDPRNSRAWPKVSGVSRDEGHSRALLVFFAAEPTDDEVRAVHDTLAAAPTAQAAPQQEAQEPYAYAVYFPDQPKVELVHDLDELIDDLTNQTHVVTKLYTAPQPAPAPLSDAVDHYLEAQDALDNREYGGINAEPYEKLLRRRNASRKDLDAAIAAQGGKT